MEGEEGRGAQSTRIRNAILWGGGGWGQAHKGDKKGERKGVAKSTCVIMFEHALASPRRVLDENPSRCFPGVSEEVQGVESPNLLQRHWPSLGTAEAHCGGGGGIPRALPHIKPCNTLHQKRQPRSPTSARRGFPRPALNEKFLRVPCGT